MHVVVTGMGVVSPIGIGVDQFWSAAVKGVSGIKKNNQVLISYSQAFPNCRRSGGLDPSTFLSQKYIEQTDRFTQLALLAARLALEDAGGLDAYESRRIGISIGSGMGGFSTFESSALRRLSEPAGTAFSPYHAQWPTPPLPGSRSSIRFKGMNLTSSTACSSGSQCHRRGTRSPACRKSGRGGRRRR